MPDEPDWLIQFQNEIRPHLRQPIEKQAIERNRLGDFSISDISDRPISAREVIFRVRRGSVYHALQCRCEDRGRVKINAGPLGVFEYAMDKLDRASLGG